MNDRPRVFLWLSVAAGALVIAALTNFLIDLTDAPDDPPLVLSDVQGVWSASNGGRLTVRPDGSAVLEQVREPEAGCGQADSSHRTGTAGYLPHDADPSYVRSTRHPH